MTDRLLYSLRDQMLDESQPLAGLLRKCLLLGAETGSESLRLWARDELNGYEDDTDIPEYRMLPTPPIMVASMSGNTWSKNISYDRLQLPKSASEVIPEQISLRQPIGELEPLSERKSISIGGPYLSYAKSLWNAELDVFQSVYDMSISITGAQITGLLDQVRTQLFEIVADITTGKPLEELPERSTVDAAIKNHIGIQYNTTIGEVSGAAALGAGAAATTHGVDLASALLALDDVRNRSKNVEDTEVQSQLLEALDDLRDTAQEKDVDNATIQDKAGRLKKTASKLGGTALQSAVSAAADTFTNLALGGAFG